LSSPSEPTKSPLDLAPVVPVVSVDHVEDAINVARALLAGGLPVIELTLRTPVALDAIRAITTSVPDIAVGAGTVATAGQAKQAHDTGAGFLVSPGCTGGIVPDTAAAYLTLPNVGCIGGSWLTPADALVTHDWARIQSLAAAAAALDANR